MDRLLETDEQRPSLVRELLCAAIHSRAAYGYAMAAGHMSNLLNFALMHTVHQIRSACWPHRQILLLVCLPIFLDVCCLPVSLGLVWLVCLSTCVSLCLHAGRLVETAC